LAWNFDGFKGVLAIFLRHGIWAANLSLIYNPLPADEFEALRTRS